MASFNSNFDITGGYHRRVRKKLPQADPCDATAALEDLGWLQQQLGCVVNLSMDWFKEFLYRKAHFFITNITMHLMDFNGKITMVSGVSGEKNIPRKPTHCYYVHTSFFPAEMSRMLWIAELWRYIKIGFFTDYRNQAWHYYSTNETTYVPWQVCSSEGK